METNLYYFSKSGDRVVYLVKEQEDGRLFITRDGETSIPNAGAFIMNFGGIDGLKAKCVRDNRSLGEIHAELYDRRKAAEKARKERARELKREAAEAAEDKLRQLASRSEDGVIPTNIDNLRIVARYFATDDMWVYKMPAMSIGYSANVYDDGTVTFKLDRPIDVGDGTKTDRIAFGKHNSIPRRYTWVR